MRLSRHMQLLKVRARNRVAISDRLASQYAVAIAYDGQTKEVVALLEYVVKVKQTTMAEIHPSWLVSEQALAHLQSVS
jgi:hypothetical protein